MTARMLYLGAVDGLKPKLDGVRRYAAIRGWEVVAVSTVGMPYEKIPAVLERIRPDGCVARLPRGPVSADNQHLSKKLA